MSKLLTLDFETEAIDFATNIPPKPVSYAMRLSTGTIVWRAWGHPEGNNCDEVEAFETLYSAVVHHDALLCHNVAFDLSVLRAWFAHHSTVVGAWDALHDTQVLAFLNDPYAGTTSLKPLAEKYLNEPPDEQDAVREWLIANKVVPRSATKAWGAHISKAPGTVVKPYCIGDVTRTWKLYRRWKQYRDDPAYLREMRTIAVCMGMEARGVPINEERVHGDLLLYDNTLAKVQRDIIKDLRAPHDFDFEKRDGFGDVLESRYGIELPRTATGRKSTAKDVLEDAVPDARMRGLLRYEGALRYYLKNYLRPWSLRGSLIHVNWRTTATDIGGARTGRLSSSPNLQNLVAEDNRTRLLDELRRMTRRRSLALPDVRSYVEAPKGYVIVGADYSQIELRLTAHYEDGPMAEGYRANPKWDLHQFVVDRVKALTGKTISRLDAKRVGFGIIYGSGGPGIARTLGVSVEEGYEFKEMYLAANPGLKALMTDVQDRGRAGGYITTLGGRRYRAQPPAMIDGERRTFEYKLTNYLIQGSAADLMKQAMVDAADAGLKLILSVHDEPVAIVPKREAKDAGRALVKAMVENDVAKQVSVPVLANAYTAIRWSEAEK